jgi:hypothetical protein
MSWSACGLTLWAAQAEPATTVPMTNAPMTDAPVTTALAQAEAAAAV